MKLMKGYRRDGQTQQNLFRKSPLRIVNSFYYIRLLVLCGLDTDQTWQSIVPDAGSPSGAIGPSCANEPTESSVPTCPADSNTTAMDSCGDNM